VEVLFMQTTIYRNFTSKFTVTHIPQLTLHDYIGLAEKAIRIHAGPHSTIMLKNEDAISFISEFLMKKAHQWDESKSNFKTYMDNCGVFGVKRWKQAYHKLNHVKDSDGVTTHVNEIKRKYAKLKSNDFQRVLGPLDLLIQKEEGDDYQQLIHAISASSMSNKRKAMVLLFLETRSFKAVAEELGVSKTHVRNCVNFSIKYIGERMKRLT